MVKKRTKKNKKILKEKKLEPKKKFSSKKNVVKKKLMSRKKAILKKKSKQKSKIVQKSYRKKRIKISQENFSFSRHLIDLREKKNKAERKQEDKKNLTTLKSEAYLDLAMDFLKAQKEFILPEDLRIEEKSRELEEDVPKFLNRLACSNNTIFHRVLDKTSNWGSQLFSFRIRTAIAFALICAFLILPVKAATLPNKFRQTKNDLLIIALQGYKALENAQNGLTDFDFALAKREFSQSENRFAVVRTQLGFFKFLMPVTRFISNDIYSNYFLLKTSEKVADLGSSLTEQLINFRKDLGLIEPRGNDLLDLSFLIEYAKSFQKEKKKFLVGVEDIENYLSKVDSSILLAGDVSRLATFKNGFNKASTVSEILPEILGEKELKRYLFIFQNNNEIRPTGGFMGSLALVDVYRGKVKNIEIPGGGPYDFKIGLLENIKSPQPMWRLNPKWEFQDANWWPDFPTSAKKIIWFYDKSGGPTVDGVIALTADLMQDLLDIFGSVEMSEYNKVITSDNFIIETQKAVELEYDRSENKPKQFIADLFFKILEEFSENLNMQDKEKMSFIFDILNVFNQGLNKKQVQIYLANESLEKKIKDLNIAGAFKENQGDYLMVVDTNIGGGKTDGVIQKSITLKSEVQSDLSIINTLNITRTHQGKENDFFNGRKNINYLRVYLPLNSVFLEAKGFSLPKIEEFTLANETLKQDKDLSKIEKNVIFDKNGTKIYQELSKTVFANWVEVNSGESVTISFKYKLPFKFTNEHSLLLQKQAGSQNIDFKAKLTLSNSQSYLFETNLERDEFWKLF